MLLSFLFYFFYSGVFFLFLFSFFFFFWVWLHISVETLRLSVDCSPASSQWPLAACWQLISQTAALVTRLWCVCVCFVCSHIQFSSDMPSVETLHQQSIYNCRNAYWDVSACVCLWLSSLGFTGVCGWGGGWLHFWCRQQKAGDSTWWGQRRGWGVIVMIYDDSLLCEAELSITMPTMLYLSACVVA